MNISETFALSWSPEAVFGSLTDPALLDRWLPAGLRLESFTGQRVRIVAGGLCAEYEISADPATRRLSWQDVESPQTHGTARVQDGPVGSSRIRFTVGTGDAVADPQRVRAALDEVVRRLQRGVTGYIADEPAAA